MLCKIRQSLNSLKNLINSHKKHVVVFAFLATFFWFVYPTFILTPGQSNKVTSYLAIDAKALTPEEEAAAAKAAQEAANKQKAAQDAEAQNKTQSKDTSNNGPDSMGNFMSLFCGILLTVAAFFLKLAIFALAFVIEVAGYNGYLDSAAVNIGWVMVRDVTNMFFVVILLLVAFGTILGLEQYEWKKMLVKFFFAAILVNFSRTICGLIIDVSQVVTITFVNGIAATAGGNLINSLNLQGLFKYAESAANDPTTVVDTKEIFAAAIGALVFSAITLGMMMVFVFMLLGRMIMLWTLIVLSPFAFVLSVIPQTEKYASQWWSEFGNHVLVGPITVFFLWLAFAVVGGGNASQELAANSVGASTATNTQIANTDAFNYNSITNFAIAIGILLAGAKISQSLGTTGGSAMSKATDFGKKVAMVGSGVAAGMWAGGKVKEGAVAVRKVLPFVGDNAWERRGKNIMNYSSLQWQKVNRFRDKGAKALEKPGKDLLKIEADRKKLDLEYKNRKPILDKDGNTDEAAEKARDAVYKQSRAESLQKEEALTSQFGSGRTARFLKGMLATNIESTVRTEKKAKVLEDAAKSSEIYTEKETSTSSSWQGQIRTRMAGIAEQAENRGKQKKDIRMQDMAVTLMMEGQLEAKPYEAEMAAATKDKKKYEDARADGNMIGENHLSDEEVARGIADATARMADAKSSIGKILPYSLIQSTHQAEAAKAGREKVEGAMTLEQRTSAGGSLLNDTIAKAKLASDTDKKKLEAAAKVADVAAMTTIGEDGKPVASKAQQAWAEAHVESEHAAHIASGIKNQSAAEVERDHAKHSQHDLETEEGGMNKEMEDAVKAAKDLESEGISDIDGAIQKINKRMAELDDALAARKSLLSQSHADELKDATTMFEAANEGPEKDKERANLEAVKAKHQAAIDGDSDIQRITAELGDLKDKKDRREDQRKGTTNPTDSAALQKQIELLEKIAKIQGDNKKTPAIKAKEVADLLAEKENKDIDSELRKKNNDYDRKDVKYLKQLVAAAKIKKDGADKYKTDRRREILARQIAGPKPNLDIAAAYWDARKTNSDTFKSRSHGELGRYVAQRAIHDSHGLTDLPSQTDLKTVESVAQPMQGMERDELVASMERAQSLTSKKWVDHRAHDDWKSRKAAAQKSGETFSEPQAGSEYSAAEQEEDQYYTLALMKLTHDTGYMDDQRENVRNKMIEDHVRNTQFKGGVGATDEEKKRFEAAIEKFKKSIKPANGNSGGGGAAVDAAFGKVSVAGVEDNTRFKDVLSMLKNLMVKSGKGSDTDAMETFLRGLKNNPSHKTALATHLKAIKIADPKLNPQMMEAMRKLGLDSDQLFSLIEKTIQEDTQYHNFN